MLRVRIGPSWGLMSRRLSPVRAGIIQGRRFRGQGSGVVGFGQCLSVLATRACQGQPSDHPAYDHVLNNCCRRIHVLGENKTYAILPAAAGSHAYTLNHYHVYDAARTAAAAAAAAAAPKPLLLLRLL